MQISFISRLFDIFSKYPPTRTKHNMCCAFSLHNFQRLINNSYSFSSNWWKSNNIFYCLSVKFSSKLEHTPSGFKGWHITDQNVSELWGMWWNGMWEFIYFVLLACRFSIAFFLLADTLFSNYFVLTMWHHEIDK